MKNSEIIYQTEILDMNWLKKQVYSNELPSRKFYIGCKNKNDEICRDEKFDGIYAWLKEDVEKNSKEYRGIVNGFRRRMGLEEK